MHLCEHHVCVWICGPASRIFNFFVCHQSGPGDRRTPPEADPRMGGAPPPGPLMGPLDGPFPRRAPFGLPPPDFYPPRGPGGPPMRPSKQYYPHNSLETYYLYRTSELTQLSLSIFSVAPSTPRDDVPSSLPSWWTSSSSPRSPHAAPYVRRPSTSSHGFSPSSSAAVPPLATTQPVARGAHTLARRRHLSLIYLSL